MDQGHEASAQKGNPTFGFKEGHEEESNVLWWCGGCTLLEEGAWLVQTVLWEKEFSSISCYQQRQKAAKWVRNQSGEKL